MAVRVHFQGSERNDTLEEDGSSSFYHYFAEEELLRVEEEKDDGATRINVDANSDGEEQQQQVPFDGMTCTAFKIDQMQLDERKRGIASFEPVTRSPE